MQIAAVRALAESQSADIGTILAVPAARIRALGPHGRGSDTFDPRELDQDLLQAMDRNKSAIGITPALIEPTDRAPLLKHRDAEIARLAQSPLDSRPPRSAHVVTEYCEGLRLKGERGPRGQGVRARMQDLPQGRRPRI